MMNLFNDNVVYILGAGFSCDRGIPTIAGFMKMLRDAHPWLEAHNRTKEANAIQNVLEHRRTSAAAAYHVALDLENIEQLFSLASLSSTSLMNDVRLAIAATIDFAVSTQSDRQVTVLTRDGLGDLAGLNSQKESANQRRYTGSRYNFYVACLVGLFREQRPTPSSTTFITFNYDTLVEDTLVALDIPFSYHLPTDESVVYDTPNHVTLTGEAVSLLKMHGSVNWSTLSPSNGSELTVFGSYADVCLKQGIPELVPPTWDKHVNDQLRAVWDAAVQALSNATRIVVIGFSMPETDVHFRYLLAAGLAKNISLRSISFVDLKRSRDTIESRAEKILRSNGSEPFSVLDADNVFVFFQNFMNYGRDLGRCDTITSSMVYPP